MRTELSHTATMTGVGSVSAGNHLISVAQQALTDMGWEDLRPAIYAAEQRDHAITEELKAAHTAYREEFNEFRQQRLKIALNKTIQKLQTDYEHVISLKAQAEERLSQSRITEASPSSYTGRFSGWLYSGLQQFFGSDDAPLIRRYDEIAQNRSESITALRRYRNSLEKVELEPELESKAETIPLRELSAPIPHSHARRLLTINSSEFQVSPPGIGHNKRNPSVGTFSDGGFTIAWQSSSQLSTPGWDVYAQCYGMNGINLGSEFLVNTIIGYDQFGPSVGAFSDGGLVIAWNSLINSTYNVHAKRYGQGVVQLGDEFQVNTNTTSNQLYPNIGAFSDGAFVVAWQSYGQDGSGYGVYARLYNTTYARLGDEFWVNAYTESDQSNPGVGAFNNGFVITWQSDGQDGDSWGIYARRYDSTGTALDNYEFQVNNYFHYDQSAPSVGAFSNGGFVVAWQSYGQDGSGYGVYARRYNSNGVALDNPEFRVNTYTINDQMYPRVGAFSNGNFVIAWQSMGQDGSDWGVYARCYNANGMALNKYEFEVNGYVLNNQMNPGVGVFPDGGFVITWESDEESDGYWDIYARLFSAPSISAPPNTPGPTIPPRANSSDDERKFLKLFGILVGMMGGMVVAMPIIRWCVILYWKKRMASLKVEKEFKGLSESTPILNAKVKISDSSSVELYLEGKLDNKESTSIEEDENIELESHHPISESHFPVSQNPQGFLSIRSVAPRKEQLRLQDELVKACEQGDVEATIKWLKQGAKPNVANTLGKPPLGAAVWGMNPVVVNELLKQMGGIAPMTWEECKRHNQLRYEEVFIVEKFSPQNVVEWNELLKQIEPSPFVREYHVKKYGEGGCGILRSSWETLRAIADFIVTTGIGGGGGHRRYKDPALCWMESIAAETERGYADYRTQISCAIRGAPQFLADEVLEEEDENNPIQKTTVTTSSSVSPSLSQNSQGFLSTSTPGTKVVNMEDQNLNGHGL